MADNLFGDWTPQKNWFNDAGKNVNNFLRDVVISYGQQSNPYAKRTPPKPSGSGTTTLKRTAATSKPATGVSRKLEEIKAAGPSGANLTAAQRFGTPGGGGPINKMFDPLFKMIESQRMAADARYAANQGNIETIYGQLTSARRNDVASTTSAYKALSDAASARSTAVSGNIDASEAARLSANDAVLQSMGLSDVASASVDNVFQ